MHSRPLLQLVPVLLLSLALADAAALAAELNPRVRMQTSHGDIVLELYPEKAPVTVANFLRYVEDGAYDGTRFHRVVRGFVIQGGGFDGDFGRVVTRPPIRNEADNGLRNLVGTISMARTPDPNSATSQFFINLKDNAPLDHRGRMPSEWGYAVFGRVLEGMEAVRKIGNLPTGPGGPFRREVPREAALIVKATLLQ